ncbi:MAG: outer membrane protein assembly factor [Bergeyella sp.]|nr:outer membrane protein assembly factor [Bergeyella sp.]
MSRKHTQNRIQKYYIFFFSATLLASLVSCNIAKKVPKGEYLLTKNTFVYTDGKVLSNELPNYVLQKPNKKQLFFLPIGLAMYNLIPSKYDTIFADYSTYPNNLRDQKLRDSLYVKYGRPELKGKSLFFDRFLYSFASPPVILETGKTDASVNNLRKRLVYRGYWDADVKYNQRIDSLSRKAEVIYKITHKNPAIINDYYYNISDPGVKHIYESSKNRSLVRAKDILDQVQLDAETKRITEEMQSKGYYKFNASGEEIFFTADTLNGKKDISLILEVRKDEKNTPYKKTTVGEIRVNVTDNIADTLRLKKENIGDIRFYSKHQEYENKALWRAIILNKGDLYSQKNLEVSRRNLLLMNNFNVTSNIDYKKGSDSILNVEYTLIPLPKYEFKVSSDITYSQLLNFGFSPAFDLTTRNIFGGAENLNTSLSGTFGSIKSTKDLGKKILAYEISAQADLSFPRFVLPDFINKHIPKRYSPISSVNLGVSLQNNIGLGRISVTTGLNYFFSANDYVTHKLTLFNTQFSFTRDKEAYYNYFPRDRALRDEVFQLYSPELYQKFLAGNIASNDFLERILIDKNFYSSLNASNMGLYNSFLQSLFNKERQTQDVVVSSAIYNFVYNEIGKKEKPHPFYFNFKFETSGNLLNLLFSEKKVTNYPTNFQQKSLFGIPFSQFIKFDIDIRKYFKLHENNTLVLRQFIGVGIPYGNSTNMPFVRSYFNGGSNDIRAWRIFGGLGPADSQLDEKVRSYAMENVKLTTNIEYRMPFNRMFEGALFVDAGNIWSTRDNVYNDHFRWNKFFKQLGVGSGFGIRINVAYVTFRLDIAYKVYNPNMPVGNRWGMPRWKLTDAVLNFAFGYPF